jgi:hypothetical protein
MSKKHCAPCKKWAQRSTAGREEVISRSKVVLPRIFSAALRRTAMDRSPRLRFALAERQLKLFKTGLQNLHKMGTELVIEAFTNKVR